MGSFVIRHPKATQNLLDGSDQRISLERGDVLGFMRRALRDPAGPDAALIRTSVSAIEPGGSMLVELTRAILMSPVKQ